MQNLKTASKNEKTGNFWTPACRLVYPSLFKPSATAKGQTDTSKFKYQATLLIPNYANIDLLRQAAEDVKKAKWTADTLRTKKVKMPILRTEDEPRFADLAEDYPLFLRVRAGNKPGVVNAAREAVDEVNEPDEVYNGRWCRASLSPYAYEVEGAGVSFGLQNVQLLDHADHLKIGRAVASASDEFEAVGDSELDDMVG